MTRVATGSERQQPAGHKQTQQSQHRNMPVITTPTDRTGRCGRTPPAGRAHRPAEVADMRILRRSRPGGLIHEYAQAP